jgi:hypothetical protein
MHPTSCFFGTRFEYNFYLMKKPIKVLHYFSLDSGMLKFFKNFTQKPSSKAQLLTLPLIWRPVWRKRLRFVNPSAEEVGGLDGTFEVFSNIQD